MRLNRAKSVLKNCMIIFVTGWVYRIIKWYIQKYNGVGEEILSRLNEDYCKQFSVDEVSIAVRRVKIDTTPGPDQVLMRAVKIKNIDKVLALIFSYMQCRP